MAFFWWYLRRYRSAVRVLMYHKVSNSHCDMLTVTTEQLTSHLNYLAQNNYQVIRLGDIWQKTLPKKPVLITFDDAYINNLELAYPLLKKHGMAATIFVPSAYIGKTSSWDIDAAPLLSSRQLKELDTKIFSLGLHSHLHQSYKDLTASEIRADLTQNIAFFNQNQIEYLPALAYPYGARPKNRKALNDMYQIFEELGIKAAFRIGNRLNPWPFRNAYEIQRIDIQGTDSFETFKRKIKWGKLI